MIFAFYGMYRVRAGYISAIKNLDLRLGKVLHDYTAVTGLLTLAFVLVISGMANPN